MRVGPKHAGRWVVGGLAMLVSLAWATSAAAQDVDELVENAQNFPQRIERLETRYLDPALLRSQFKLESRFNEAKVAFMLEDYDRASLLFVSIVDNADPDEFKSYREALYYLGESLYEGRNFLSAKNYFRSVVDLGPGEFYQDSIVRLLEIAARVEDYSSVDDLYDRFDRKEEMSAAVHYMRGKTLYDQGRYEEAETYFERAQDAADYTYRSRYFRGVCRVAREDFEGGREIFRGIVDEIDPQGDLSARIVRLSYLALGRIAYELGEVERALNAYQRIPRDSRYFDRALYELTWVLVSRKNYKAASRNADIFLYLANPDPTLVPEMELLKADLLLRRDEYDEATQAYRTVMEDFEPVRRRMREFLAGKSDVRGFFDDLVEREMEGEETRYLPKKVQRWIDDSESMNRVRKRVRDVSELRDDIQQTEEALDELEARLGSGSRVESFPKIAEGMTFGIETESELLALQAKLLNAEFELLRPTLSESELEEWRQLREELNTFRERYEEVPKTRAAVQQRGERLQSEFSRLRDKLDDVAFLLEGQQEQLAGIDEYIREEYGGNPPKSQRDKIEKLREEVEQRIRKLKKREKQLRRKLAETRQKLGLGDEVTDREQGMRETYRKMLAERRQFLTQFHDRVGADKSRQLEKLKRAWETVPEAHSRLQGYFGKMRELVAERTRDLQKTLARERRRLQQQKQRLVDLRARSKKVAGKVAYQNYRRVQKKFDEIVMRGDVGLIDVAWQKKEEQTDALNQLRADRQAALKELKESFEEVR